MFILYCLLILYWRSEQYDNNLKLLEPMFAYIACPHATICTTCAKDTFLWVKFALSFFILGGLSSNTAGKANSNWIILELRHRWSQWRIKGYIPILLKLLMIYTVLTDVSSNFLYVNRHLLKTKPCTCLILHRVLLNIHTLICQLTQLLYNGLMHLQFLTGNFCSMTVQWYIICTVTNIIVNYLYCGQCHS